MVANAAIARCSRGLAMAGLPQRCVTGGMPQGLSRLGQKQKSRRHVVHGVGFMCLAA